MRMAVLASNMKCQKLQADRKSTRLNSSHGYISYAVFCLKKKNNALSTIILMNLELMNRAQLISPCTSRRSQRLPLHFHHLLLLTYPASSCSNCTSAVFD